MDEEEARRRFAAARVGRLATITANRTPHLVPVVFAVVGEVLYSAVDSKPKTTMALQRLTNIADNGQATVLVDEYSEDWSNLWWVRATGSARVLPAGGTDQPTPSGTSQDQVRLAVDALTHKYPQYIDHPPPGPVVALHLDRWRWWEATPGQEGT